MLKLKFVALIKIFSSKVFSIHTGLVLSVFVFYSLIYKILPDGVNRIFVLRSGRLAIVFLALWFLAFSTTFVYKKRNEFVYRNIIAKFTKSDLVLLLLPLTPIVQYIILNQDRLRWSDSLLFFSIFCVATFCFSFVAPFFVGIVTSRHTLMLLGISLTFCLFSMPSWSLEFGWYNRGSLRIQLVFFILIFSILSLLYFKKRRILYVFTVIFFVSNTVMNAISYRVPKRLGESKMYGFVNGKIIKNKPDIYLLTYDSYVGNETMLQYGIDNSEQESHLKKLGFKIYNSTYSLGYNSLLSMSKVLDVSRHSKTRVITSGNGSVQNILKSLGYKTYGVFGSSYLLMPTKVSYDFYVPKDFIKGYQLLAKAVGEGQFRFDIGFEKFNHLQFISEKRNVLMNDSPQPKFVYAHADLPGHSQNSGKCLDDETHQFKKRLAKANIEMKEDIDAIINSNRDAIIIINGDHGPMLTADCHYLRDYQAKQIYRLTLQDRFGCFLAIKWPNDKYHSYDEIAILQDIFPSVFSYIFEDKSILGSKLDQISDAIKGVYIDTGIIINGSDNRKALYKSDEE